MEWWGYLVVPVLSYIGTLAAVRTEIAWIKRELARHDRELEALRADR